MGMKLAIAAVTLLLLASMLFPYKITKTRDEMLEYYYRNVDEKIPKSARMLLGDEKINVYIGSQPIGIETRRGYLYMFETTPVSSPTMEVRVSPYAAERLNSGQEGVMSLIGAGEIRVEGKNLLSSIKLETIKRIYAVSGADEKITGKRAPLNANFLIAGRTRIAG